ncbi:MAG: FemAB family XrtA/PEP-CTERM system-associated protein [bacterium]
MNALLSQHKSAPDQSACKLQVRLATSKDQLAWDQYVLAHAEGSFFHKYAWGRIIEKCYGHKAFSLIVVDDEDKIYGIAPFTLVNSPFFGKSLISTAFTVGGGLLSSLPLATDLLCQYAQTIGCEQSIKYIELRGGKKPLGWQEKNSIYAGFVKSIAVDDDENLKNIPRKKRADVRKGIKAYTENKIQLDLNVSSDRFYPLYAVSVHNLGTPIFPRNWLRLIAEEFPDETEVSILHVQGEDIAGLVSFYYKDTVLPYYAGAGPAARRLHAYDFLYWSLMGRAREKGVQKFDFGRSKIGTGPYDYKCWWGFEPKPLSYYYKLITAADIPNVNPNNPKFKLVSQSWKRLPLPVANFVGPFLASNLA